MQESPLKITKETSAANLIRAWEPGRLLVGEQWLEGNIIVTADEIVRDWAIPNPLALSIGDLAPAIGLHPEIILLGTGATAQMPDIGLMSALAERGIGLEIMDTPAACRTYNVLVHEQRRVVAALLGPNEPIPG